MSIMSDIKKKDPTITKIILETLDDSIMTLCFPYTKLIKLERMGIKTIRDLRDYEFGEDADQDILNTQRHFKAIWGDY